ELHDFFEGQTLTAGSSGWLADAYVRDQDRLDGIINYESILLSLNSENKLREPLVLIYPKEGIVTADYPLVLLNEGKRDAYAKLVAFLRTPEFQRTIMTATNRRPANPDVPLDARFPKALIVELPFPSDLGVVDKILEGYLEEQRRPAHSYFLLDVSGSMRGQRLNQLQRALFTLAGEDSSLTGRFARFQPRERVSIRTFSDAINDRKEFELGTAAQAPAARDSIKSYVSQLLAGGGTALFSSLQAIYQNALTARGADPDRYFSILVMTDGVSNEGISFQEFERFYNTLPAVNRDIKVFPIIFGDADRAQLTQIANLTGGRLFDGNTASLAAVFKEIRGYQ
ncbi:MAG TPA: VWA domain-containing protein, partial [Gemmatimonadaceae bacterium]|nr:VWA domain-containing protein [Gemmatimonadaceae bacterium]